jgi:ATP-dependent Clp protease ATP-binding subunit ClpC
MKDYGRIQRKAIQEAERLGHTGIGCEHLLLGVLADEQGIAGRILAVHGVTLGAARTRVDRIIGYGWRDAVRWTYSPRATVVERLAAVEAERLGGRQPTGEHLTLALINEGGSIAVTVLMELGVDLRLLRADLVRATDGVLEEVQERYIRDREAYERAEREQGGRYGWWQLPLVSE